MPRVEIMIWPEAIPANGTQDGMPTDTWMPPGQLLTSAELQAWWSTGTPPSKFSLLTKADGEKIKREAMRVKYLTDVATTVKAATLVKYGEAPPGNAHWSILRDRDVHEANVQAAMRQAADERSKFVAEGFDTNWGYLDLRKKLIIVADITTEELHDYMIPPDDETVHVFGNRRNKYPKRYRFEYWKHFDAAKVAKIRAQDIRVDVDRTSTPFTFAEIATLVT